MGAFDMRRNAIAGQNTVVMGGQSKPFDEADIQALFEGYQGIWLDATDQTTMFKDTFGNSVITNNSTLGAMYSKASTEIYGSELKDDVYSAKLGSILALPVRNDNEIWTIERLESTANLTQVRIPAQANAFYRVDVSVLDGAVIQIRAGSGTYIQDLPIGHHVGTYTPSGFTFLNFQHSQNYSTSTLKINSAKKLNGYHAVQSTTSKRPLLNNGLVKFDGSDDELPFTFDSALSNCTIIRTTKTDTTILTSQSITQEFYLNQDYCQYLLINRALTSDLTEKIQTFFERKAGIV